MPQSCTMPTRAHQVDLQLMTRGRNYVILTQVIKLPYMLTP